MGVWVAGRGAVGARRVGRWLRVGLIVSAVALVLLLIGVEAAGRIATERVAEDQLRQHGVNGGVEVTLGRAWWRPTFLPALLTGDLDRISVQLSGADLYSVPVQQADYVLENLHIDFSLRQRSIAATSIGSGSVRVLIDPAAIGRMMATDAAVVDGRLLIGADRERADLRMVGNQLVLSAPSLDAAGSNTSFQVVDPQLLPCVPQVQLSGGLVELSCSGDQLPGILEQSIGSSAGVDPGEPPAELEPPLTIDAPTTTAPTVTAPTTGAPATTPTGGNDGGG